MSPHHFPQPDSDPRRVGPKATAAAACCPGGTPAVCVRVGAARVRSLISSERGSVGDGGTEGEIGKEREREGGMGEGGRDGEGGRRG